MVPDQFPDAVHALALVVAQLRLEEPPLATLVGVALKVRVGAGVTTATTTDFAAVPPAPLHANVKVPAAESGPDDCVPLICR